MISGIHLLAIILLSAIQMKTRSDESAAVMYLATSIWFPFLHDNNV